MKILNISTSDWARFQWDNMNALCSVGIHCDSITRNRHHFYEEQSEIVPEIKDICQRMQDYDVIQFFHDDLNLYRQIKPALLSKKVIVYHTSSAYRATPEGINHEMKNADRHVCAMPEFMAMCPGAIYMVGAVDTDKLYHNEDNGDGFGHYPSNPKVKGTDRIIELMSGSGIELSYSTDQVGYEDQIKRIRSCKCYIEMFTERDGNARPYGDFGITALEAAAMGIPVITNARNWEVYFNVYGRLPFLIANDEREFLKQVTLVQNIPYYRIFCDEFRSMIVYRHSYKASGEYFLKHVL